MTGQYFTDEEVEDTETNHVLAIPSYFTKFPNWNNLKVSSTSPKNINHLSPQERMKQINRLACQGILGKCPGTFITNGENEYLNTQLKYFAGKQSRFGSEKNDESDNAEFGGSGPHLYQNENRYGHRHTASSASGVSAQEKSPTSHNNDKYEGARLPTQWNIKHDVNLDVSNDGLTVSTEHPVRTTKKKTRLPFGSTKVEKAYYPIKSDRPICMEAQLYYFEVTVLASLRGDPGICVGFARLADRIDRDLSDMKGCVLDVWSYDSKEGEVSTCWDNKKITKKCPTFTVGDVIGCGVNFTRKCVFFTKNGNFLGEALPIGSLNQHYYPSLSMTQWNKVSTNFGTTKAFVFDIDQYVESIKKSTIEKIEMEKAVPLEVKGIIKIDDDQDIKNATNKLVKDYFILNGMEESLKSFGKEIQIEEVGNEQEPAYTSSKITKLLIKVQTLLMNDFYQDDTQEEMGVGETLLLLPVDQEGTPGWEHKPELVSIRFGLKCIRLFKLIKKNDVNSALEYANKMINMLEFQETSFYNHIAKIMRFCFMKDAPRLTEFRVEYAAEAVRTRDLILSRIFSRKLDIDNRNEIDKVFETVRVMLEQKSKSESLAATVDFANDYITL